MPVSREQIIECIRAATEPLDYVHAYYLGGSTAFGRDDEFSDVDAQLIVDDAQVERAFAAVELALGELSPIAHRLVVPEPAWHGHSQRFYNLRDASRYNQVDLFVLHYGREPYFNEIELHGQPYVIFDKDNAVHPVHMDRLLLRETLLKRLKLQVDKVEMFSYMVEKEFRRGHPLAALHFYQGLMLAPLVEVLRMQYSPFRHDWGVRYAHTDLPLEVHERLAELYFVRDLDELMEKFPLARAWFDEVVEQLDLDAV